MKYIRNKKKWLALVYFVLREQQKRKRKEQVHPLNRIRSQQGEYFTLIQMLEKFPIKFFEYLRMSQKQFNFILNKIQKDLTPKNNLFRSDHISAKEKLVLTLRFLATGASFADLSFRFLMGRSTVRKSIILTIKSINKHLQKLVLPVPKSRGEWKTVSDAFLKIWNFPNCLGAVDGKHIRMFAHRKSGSFNFNYKKCFSTILMAVVDANYRFIMVSIGAYGSNPDPTVFSSCNFGNTWINNPKKLFVPADDPFPGTTESQPFVLVGDEAFGLKYNLMTPFAGSKLSPKQRIYNYSLSRARRIVESTFRILVYTWRVLLKALEVQMAVAKPLILCCCVLNNFLQTTKENLPTTNNVIMENDTNLIDHDARVNQPASNAVNIRNAFAEWFLNEGSVEFQWNK